MKKAILDFGYFIAQFFLLYVGYKLLIEDRKYEIEMLYAFQKGCGIFMLVIASIGIISKIYNLKKENKKINQ